MFLVTDLIFKELHTLLRLNEIIGTIIYQLLYEFPGIHYFCRHFFFPYENNTLPRAFYGAGYKLIWNKDV